MLVLSRKPSQRIIIGKDIIVTIVASENGKVRIGIDAPSHIQIDREEIREAKDRGLPAPMPPHGSIPPIQSYVA